MKTLQIMIKNGRIDGHVGAEVAADWDANHISGNGWYCIVSTNGTITCVASKNYENGRQIMKFVLTPGRWAKLTFKKGNSRAQLIKNFRFKNWPINGIISLSDGEISKRRANFAEK